MKFNQQRLKAGKSECIPEDKLAYGHAQWDFTMKLQGKEIELTKLRSNGIELNLAAAGPLKGKPVFLLHGFPEAWFAWEEQMLFLADKGFRVYAPDQRGYNLSDKPGRVEDYCAENMVKDLMGLVDVLGYENICLAGHDWGGVIAYLAAIEYPHRVERLAVLNAPHPAAFKRHIKSSISQSLKSWYVLYFQIPLLPEFVMKALDWQPFWNQLPDLPHELQDRYRASWQEPDAINSMLNWYRAALRFPPQVASEQVRVPVLIIWGENDKYLSRKLAKKSLSYCAQGRIEYLSDASHWVCFDQTKRVNELLLEQFQTN